MREKVKELLEPVPENDELQKPIGIVKSSKTSIHITIKAFPDLSKIIVYLVKDWKPEQLMEIESDLRSYFSAHKGKYHLDKTQIVKEEP
jgi:hypothetical protein